MQIKEMKELIEEKVNELMEEAASNKTADMSVIEERKSFIFLIFINLFKFDQVDLFLNI